MTLGQALALAGSYLVGAIPASYLVARLGRGIDLREHGSGNLGATNLYRTLGWKFAVPVGIFDIGKGAVPVLFFAPAVSASRFFALACGLTAVVGHVFSVFVRFKGGKGVATAAGAMLAIAPLAIGVLLVVWTAVVFATGYVSVGSIVAAALLPLCVWLLHPESRELVPVVALIAAAIVWLHRANLRRLRAGTESRFGKHRAATRAS